MVTQHDPKLAALVFAIEQALMDIPGVEAGVAVPLKRRGHETMGVYVTVRTGMHLSAERVLEECHAKLGAKRSPSVVVFGKDVPLTVEGEVDRAKLRTKFA